MTYSAAISACDKSSNAQEALKLLQELKDAKVGVDTITYGAAISLARKAVTQWRR